MNKYDFIAEFLEKEKLDVFQKERVVKLIVTELKNDGVNQTEIENRLRKIEQKLTTQIPQIQPEEKTDLPSYKDPTQLSLFLKAYNQNSILKYTCHKIDTDGLKTINEICETTVFSLEKYQEQLTNSFNALLKTYTIPRTLWSLIDGYLNGSKHWTSDKIRLNWKAPELVEWCKNNPGIVPNPDNDLIALFENHGFEFNDYAFKSKILQTRISSFSQLVIHFKCLFHIRSDNSLRDLLLNINKTEKWNDQIDFDTTDLTFNIQFFTDIDKLIQAYKKIIRIIIEITDAFHLGRPVVKLSLSEDNNLIKFSINHENSVFKKTLNETLKRSGQWETELIKRQINGLCDFYIVADFGNEYARVNIWNGKNKEPEMLNKCTGVEYQLIFK